MITQCQTFRLFLNRTITCSFSNYYKNINFNPKTCIPIHTGIICSRDITNDAQFIKIINKCKHQRTVYTYLQLNKSIEIDRNNTLCNVCTFLLYTHVALVFFAHLIEYIVKQMFIDENTPIGRMPVCRMTKGIRIFFY